MFCNPPYGKELPLWVKKCYEEHVKYGTTIVMLIPARTDTRYFHEYIYNKSEIRFIRGRLKFNDCKQSAPFPSMLVIFKENKQMIDFGNITELKEKYLDLFERKDDGENIGDDYGYALQSILDLVGGFTRGNKSMVKDFFDVVERVLWGKKNKNL